jgi:hypothetical protein
VDVFLACSVFTAVSASIISRFGLLALWLKPSLRICDARSVTAGLTLAATVRSMVMLRPRMRAVRDQSRSQAHT